MKTWLTVAEGAEYSGVSRDTIYTACGSIRLKAEWIDAWLERHSRGAEAWRAAGQGSVHGGVS
jgi:hypothetical protein